MSSTVGTKGQIVIAKEIRDKLGIRPGWKALQVLVDGHVEVYFVRPEHNRSLFGVLAPHITKRPPDDMEWSEIKEKAWEEAAMERRRRLDRPEDEPS